MLYNEALDLARKGELVTRKSMGESFLLVRDGKTLKGRYMGESSFIESKAYSPNEDDRNAADWAVFARTVPDAWEGCDAPFKR